MSQTKRTVADIDATDLITTLAKYGVGSVIAIYLVYTMTQGLSADVKGIQTEARGIRAEHMQMSMYLQAICLGVNHDPKELWRCYPTAHPAFPLAQLPAELDGQ